MKAEVLIVGASSAKTFKANIVGDHDQFLDALWNRNGRSCHAMYEAAVPTPSKSRPNLDRLSAMLAARGLKSLQTNVACASARYDTELSQEDRAHGTELFKAIVANLPWRAMIVYGVGASRRFGKAFGVDVPEVPPPDTLPVHVKFDDRKVFVAPTLAPPGYRSSVWPYLERVVDAIAGDAPKPVMPAGFKSSPANTLVWDRTQRIAEASDLTIVPSTFQASLTGGVAYGATTRVFRHKFKTATPDLLLREDAFRFGPGLHEAATWTRHKTPVFQALRTDDHQLLVRILDVVEAFATAKTP